MTRERRREMRQGCATGGDKPRQSFSKKGMNVNGDEAKTAGLGEFHKVIFKKKKAGYARGHGHEKILHSRCVYMKYCSSVEFSMSQVFQGFVGLGKRIGSDAALNGKL